MTYQEIFESLKTSFEQNTLASAYLFSGAKGFGKRKLADLFAQMVLCLPDNENSKRKVVEGAHPDYKVIGEDFEQKTIKIQEVREIQGWLSLKPFEASWKVLLVLEAERLTLEAQNAFLKTLEEPPANSFIIFTSVNSLKLLPTILSRITEIRLQPVPAALLIERLKREFQLGDEAAFVAYEARGSFEQAQGIVESGLLEMRQDAFRAFFDRRISDYLKSIEAKGRTDLQNKADALINLFSVLIRDLIFAANTSTMKALINRDFESEIAFFSANADSRDLLKAFEKFRELENYLIHYVSVKMVLSNIHVVLNRLYGKKEVAV